MKQEDKDLLLKDLCARIPYGVICHYNCVIRCDTMEINKANCIGKLEGIIPFNGRIGFMVGGDKVNALFGDIKPYLRSMSSMTEEEYDQLYIDSRVKEDSDDILDALANDMDAIDWLNAHHFDYRGLIPKGLAIEVTKENNLYENINL